MRAFIKQHVLIILLSAVFSLLAVLISGKFGYLGTDAVFYALMAESVARGDYLQVYGFAHVVYSPFLSILAAPIVFVGITTEVALHAVVILSSLGMMWLTYILGCMHSDKKVGILSAFFLVATGVFTWSSAVVIIPQFTAGLFALIALLLLICAVQTISLSRRLYLLLLSGVSLGCAYLTRPEYFFLIVCTLLFVWWSYRMKSLFVIHLLGFILVASPYLLYLYIQTGELTISGRVAELSVIVSTPDYEDVDTSIGSTAAIITPPSIGMSGFQYVTQRLPQFAKRTADNILNTERTITSMFGIFGIFFFVFGAWISFCKDRVIFLLCLIFLTPLLLVAIAQGGSPHYIVQFLPLFALWIALGLQKSIHCLTQEVAMFRIFAKPILVSFTLCFGLYLSIPLIQNVLFLPDDYRQEEYRLMGEWMHRTLPDMATTVVLSRKPEPTYYAQSLWQVIPSGLSVFDLHMYMRDSKIEYLLIDSRSISVTRPELESLVSGDPEQFDVVHEIQHHGSVIRLLSPKMGSATLPTIKPY
jgi:4-amino-4-deoxy-L-arabinose transferase-like glycosyltransferase